MSSTSIWDEFEIDPREVENALLRASDSDRDAAHRALGRAYSEGRLDRAEFDQRSEEVLNARTLGQLPPVLADLVPTAAVLGRARVSPLSPEALQERALAEYRSDLREAFWGFLSASLICWVIWFVAGRGFPWPVFVSLGTGLNVLRLLVRRADHVDSERQRLERKQLKALQKQERRSSRPGSEGTDST